MDPYTIAIDKGESNKQSHIVGYDCHPEICHLGKQTWLSIAILSV